MSSSRTSPGSSRQERFGFYALRPRQISAPVTRSRPDDYRRQKDDARGPMGPPDGPALPGQHATPDCAALADHANPDCATAALAAQKSEAVTGAYAMTRGRLSFGPPLSLRNLPRLAWFTTTGSRQVGSRSIAS